MALILFVAKRAVRMNAVIVGTPLNSSQPGTGVGVIFLTNYTGGMKVSLEALSPR